MNSPVVTKMTAVARPGWLYGPWFARAQTGLCIYVHANFWLPNQVKSSCL